MLDPTAVRVRIKELIVTNLNLEGMQPQNIGDEDRLFGEGLGLDSVDALELVVALEKEFGISVQNDEMDRSVFASVATLAEFVVRTRVSAPSDSPNG